MADGGTASFGRVVVGALIALAVALGASFLLRSEEEAAPVTDQPALAETPAAAVEAPTEAPAEPEVLAEAPAEADDTPGEAAADAPQGPLFDTFRVDPEGEMVIAGRAGSGQTVAIVLGGDEIERVEADAAGNFVAFAFAGYSDQPRKLVLVADPDGAAVASETTYIVSPILEPLPQVAAADPSVIEPDPEAQPGPQQGDPLDTSGAAAIPGLETVEPAPVIAGDIPDLPGAEAETGEPTLLAGSGDSPSANPATPEEIEEPLPVPPQQLAPTVLQADADGITVQQSAPADPEVENNVALEAITYAPDGDVQLSGRAQGEGTVQVYIDNSPVIASPVAEGDWSVELSGIATGVYTLRVDEIDTEGEVVSRVETPFKREEPSDVAAIMADETAREDFEVAVRTVQPGSTLWAIAEETLGDGIFYVQVFELNRDLIKDPNLIYPGQIFRLPDGAQSGD